MSFVEEFTACRQVIQTKYKVPVTCALTINNNPGIFDGRRIIIFAYLDPETKLFVLAHIFGHTVQWNVSEEARKIGFDSTPGKKEDELGPIFHYERDASRIGLSLMHECGVVERDQWLADWFRADWLFLKHFYLTGLLLEPKNLFIAGAGAPLDPLPISNFEPKAFEPRAAF